jgi:uncharacterized repeat protein (TIGR02543 family)
VVDGVTTSQTLNYGVTPSYGESNPVKAATAQYTYTFKTWNPSIAAVTESATYTAVFDSTLNQYTINFGAATAETGSVAATVGGTAISNGAAVNYGASVTITTEPSDGYYFLGLTNNSGEQVTNPFSLVKDTTISAVFMKDFVGIDTLKYTLTSVTTVSVGVGQTTPARKTIDIPQTVTHNGFTFNVTEIEENAFNFYSHNNITTVTVPEGVTTIGKTAFSSCEKLTQISLPSTLVNLGSYVFQSCSALATVTVADGNTAYCVVDGVLYNNDKTTLVVYPAAKAGTSFTIPASVTRIDKCAFRDCQNLTSVTFAGNNVTTIDEYAFYNCKFSSVSIPANVVTIGVSAFSKCTIAAVTIPAGVQNIGYGAFTDCGNLTEITVASGNSSYTSVDGVLFSYNRDTLVQYPAGKTAESYTVDDGVKVVGSQAFNGCSNLTSLTIGGDVERIEDYVVANCQNLQTVAIGNKVESMGMSMFSNCRNLRTVTIPSSVTQIGTDQWSGAFSLCSSVTVYCEADSKPENWIINSMLSSSQIKYGCKYITVTADTSKGSVTIDRTNLAVEAADGLLWYENGKTATFTASPADHYHFVNWNGDDNLTNATYSFTVAESIVLTANFAINSHTVTYKVDGAVSGEVETYNYGETITIRTKPSKAGYTFAGWSDGNTTHNENSTFSVPDSDVTLTAQWTVNKYTITFGVATTGTGSVTAKVSGTAISSGASVNYGTDVVLTAAAGSGYAFNKWNDGNTDNPRTVNVTESATYTAVFDETSNRYAMVNGVLCSNLTATKAAIQNTTADIVDVVLYENVTVADLGKSGTDGSIINAIMNSTKPVRLVVDKDADIILNDCQSMFTGCETLVSADLRGLNTTDVTGMNTMFGSCTNLTMLDVSGWNTSNVAEMFGMFLGCTSLTTIFAESGANWHAGGIFADDMFRECSKLKGGNGTECDGNNNVNGTRARVDGGEGEEGYFTVKYNSSSASYAIESVADNKTTTITLSDNFTAENVRALNSALKNLKTAKPNAKVILNMSGVTGFTEFESASSGYSTNSFYNCTNLAGIMLPECLTTISSNAFYGCTGLTEIHIPASVKTISSAFSQCSNLQSVTFAETHYWDNGNSTIDVADAAEMAQALKNPMEPFYRKDANELYATVNNSIYNNKNTTITAITNAANAIDVVIYGRVTASDLGGAGTEGTIINAIKNCSQNVSLVVVEDANIALGGNDCKEMFKECANLISADLRGFKTSGVTSMFRMFNGCEALATLNLSSFNTSNVTEMHGMFLNCKALASLDLYNFNTSSVTDMNFMFGNCSELTTLKLCGFKTDNVVYLNGMFSGCSKLASIYASIGANWGNSDKLENSENMFLGCTSIVGDNSTTYNSEYIDASYARNDRGTSDPGYFIMPYAIVDGHECSDKSTTITAIENATADTVDVVLSGKVSASDLGKAGTSGTILSAIQNSTNPVRLVVAADANIILSDCEDMFWACKKLVSADLRGLNTSNVTSMICMFDYCEALTTLDLSSFNTSKVTSMREMFSSCKALTSLDLSSFTAERLTEMHNMFCWSPSLVTIDLSNFNINVSKVGELTQVFQQCNSLTTIYVPAGTDWSSISSSTRLFDACSNLKGGNGTVYSSENIGSSYAKVDGLNGNPGYFTVKP